VVHIDRTPDNLDRTRAGRFRTRPAGSLPQMIPRLVLLAGPSGSGKTHLAEASGLPLLDLDDFYKDGADPTAPRHPTLGIVDWDDPRSWDAGAALTALEAICRDGAADVPVYDISHDGRVGTRRFSLDGAPAFVGTGIFAAELVRPARERGLLVDAIAVRRSRVKNFLRRLSRDLRERRKPPLTLVRRGLTLMRAEPSVVARQLELGCRPCDRDGTLAGLRRAGR
jgi:uridine kinase